MMREVDVLVIGGGIAGSMAAREASKNGAKTLIVEKKAEIGTPKRCAEGIQEKALENLNIKPDKRWIARRIDSVKLASTDFSAWFTPENIKTTQKGYILERKVFDKHMTMDAIRAGAEVYIKTEAIDFKRDEEGYIIVTLKHEPETILIKASIVIGADGPEGHVGAWAGLNTKVSSSEMESGAQYEMTNIKLENPDAIEFYFGSMAPGGYAWIFPKGFDCANVGIDISSSKANKTAIEYLDDFILGCDELQGAQPVELNVGGNPLCGVFDKIVTDNVMLVGDAAGCINPVTGGGIDTALESGMIAGRVAAKAIKDGNFKEDAFKEYEDYVEEHIGSKFRKLLKLRDFVYDLEDDDYNAYVKALSKIEMDKLSMNGLIKALIKTSPRKLLKLRKLIL